MTLMVNHNPFVFFLDRYECLVKHAAEQELVIDTTKLQVTLGFALHNENARNLKVYALLYLTLSKANSHICLCGMHYAHTTLKIPLLKKNNAPFSWELILSLLMGCQTDTYSTA